MLRTIAGRSEIFRNAVKNAVKTNITRCLSVECSRQRHIQRLRGSSSVYKNGLLQQSKAETLIRHYSDYPSHKKVLLPALSPTMESGTIVSWEKKEGDQLNEGDLLAEIETDKATMGFETPEEGYLAKILVPAGSKNVPIGQLVCIIVENAEDVAKFKDYKDDSPAVKPSAAAPPPPPPPSSAPSPPTPPPPAPTKTSPPVASPPVPVKSGDRVYASPLAKRLAAEKGLQLSGQGSGLYGSITSADLAAGLPGSAPSAVGAPVGAPIIGAEFTDHPVTNIRGVIAKRLLQSKQTIPHYYLTMDVQVDELLKLRKRFQGLLEKEKSSLKVTINDFVIKAVAMASRKVPEANSAWMDSFIREYHNVDVSVAVATDKGLITPIIFGADSKGIAEISTTIKGLAAKAKEGKLQPHEFQGGTIAVSNLGMFGISSFSAVINPPQSCILAVGGSRAMLIPDKSEKGFKEATIMSVTLSCDHRVVDGAVGARWLQVFKQMIENPETMLL